MFFFVDIPLLPIWCGKGVVVLLINSFCFIYVSSVLVNVIVPCVMGFLDV